MLHKLFYILLITLFHYAYLFCTDLSLIEDIHVYSKYIFDWRYLRPENISSFYWRYLRQENISSFYLHQNNSQIVCALYGTWNLTDEMMNSWYYNDVLNVNCTHGETSGSWYLPLFSRLNCLQPLPDSNIEQLYWHCRFCPISSACFPSTFLTL